MLMSNAFHAHDHDACIHEVMRTVEVQCAEKELNLTDNRRAVLEILLSSHHAMGAYEILDALSERGMKSQPPIAYRALDFLIENGFVHKLESRNAYVACSCPARQHEPAFFICRKCENVAETVNVTEEMKLDSLAKDQGFEIETRIVEAEGCCASCRGKEA